jgi:hypothetical protein
MPEAAPVTNTTLSAKRFILSPAKTKNPRPILWERVFHANG